MKQSRFLRSLDEILNSYKEGKRVYFLSGENYDPYIIDIGLSKDMKKKHHFRDPLLFGDEQIAVFDIQGGFCDIEAIEIEPERFYLKEAI